MSRESKLLLIREGTSVLGQVSGKGHELDEVIKSLGSYFQENSLLKRKNKVSLKDHDLCCHLAWAAVLLSSVLAIGMILGRFVFNLCASVLSSIKWEWQKYLPVGVTVKITECL